jgi:hypothetical protein
MKLGLRTGIQFLKRKLMIQKEYPIIAKSISRYHVERLIRKVDSNTYIVEGETSFTRGTTDGTMADFEGGPYLETNMSARIADIPDNREIESVKFLDCDRKEYAKVEVKLKAKS